MSLTTRIFVCAVLASAAFFPAAGASDPSVDRLLKKLPPPEKIVRPLDPVVNDPLAKKTLAAVDSRNFSRALGLSRQLSRRYPASVVARGLHGWLALVQSKFGEATLEFQSAIQIEPNYSFGYFGLGLAEAAQKSYANALRNFQQVSRMEPKVEVVWLASSGCAEQLGKRQESRDYAKRATEIAPKSTAAWLQLARAEAAIGHKVAAQRAAARAKQLGATRSTSKHG